MNALCAWGNFARGGISRSAERDFVCFLVDSGLRPGIKKGVSDSAESDLGLCPKDPQTFEKV